MRIPFRKGTMSLGSQVTPDSPLVDAVEAGIIRKLEFKEESVEEMPQLTLDCSAFMHAPVNWVWSRLPLRWDFLTFLMTAIVRFWRISQPPGVVFDESHFGKFTQHYQRGTYVFDIHPPLGKITFAYLGFLIGYDNHLCQYDNINDQYGPNCEYWKLRCISAFFGSLLSPLTFRITKELGGSDFGAFFASCLITFDMLNSTESRLVLMDAQLMFWVASGVYAGILLYKRWNAHTGPLSEMVPMLLFTGFVCGCAISIKWTTLVTPAIVAIESCFGVWFMKRPLPFAALLLLGGTIILTYIWWFWVHFAILWKTNDREKAFIPVEFSAPYIKTLVGHPEYELFPMLNYEMWLVNTKMTQPHHWQSRYTQWVVNGRGLSCYHDSVQPDPDIKDVGVGRLIYMHGSPAVIWLTSAMICVWAILCGLYLRFRNTVTIPAEYRQTLLMCSYLVFAWFFNLLPYMAVNRSSFVYHYMPGLLNAEIMTALLLDRFCGRYRKPVMSLLLVVIIVTFIYFAPWMYALPINEVAKSSRVWYEGWK